MQSKRKIEAATMSVANQMVTSAKSFFLLLLRVQLRARAFISSSVSFIHIHARIAREPHSCHCAAVCMRTSPIDISTAQRTFQSNIKRKTEFPPTKSIKANRRTRQHTGNPKFHH